jgi:rhodanese-related sulfurtransferase
VCAAVVAVLAATGCSSSEGKPSAAGSRESAATSGQAAPGTESFARLEPAAFAGRMGDKGAVLINVHVPYEGEIERTDAFIPYDRIVGDTRLPTGKSTEILLYCRSGRMSEMAGKALHDAGYTNLAHLEGGMRAWEATGRTLLQDPAHAAAGHQ